MALIVRGNKASGGTSFVTGTTILDDEVDTDFDRAYTEINGNLDDANIKTAADITLTKLADISATAATHDDTSSPGDSASHTLPTTASGELQQLRYVEERQALGVAAQRVDGTGTGTTFWGDLPARGHNLIVNPNFAARDKAAATNPPDGWSDLGTGTPTFSWNALSGATKTEGAAREVGIVAGSAAVAGITQTLAGLKASTRYLVVVRARGVTNAAHVKTTGADATSSFRNINDSNSSSTYATIKGVIQTDSTPTDVVIQLTTNGASADSARFAFCGVYECSADLLQIGQAGTIEKTSTGPFSPGTGAHTTLVSDVQLTAPGPGYEIHIDAHVPVENTTGSNDVIGIRLVENAVAVESVETFVLGSSIAGIVVFRFVRVAVPGTTYAYSIDARTATGTWTNGVPGSGAVTGMATRTIRLRVRLVRVSA